MSKKFLCLGAFVISKNDNQQHYIAASQLPLLYGVNPKECIFVDARQADNLRGLDLSNYIVLQPSSDGDYELPETNNA
jgi:hypothetical protein